MRSCLWGVLLVAVLTLLPSTASAQASVAGSTRDTSGAALPGVTVEASSPALIEKVRTAVSDASGLYRIVNLPPGTYSVTFSLPGFNNGVLHKVLGVGFAPGLLPGEKQEGLSMVTNPLVPIC